MMSFLSASKLCRSDGIFKDEDIIFDNLKPDWKEFCQNTFAFEIPVYEAIQAQASKSQNKSHC